MVFGCWQNHMLVEMLQLGWEDGDSSQLPVAIYCSTMGHTSQCMQYWCGSQRRVAALWSHYYNEWSWHHTCAYIYDIASTHCWLWWLDGLGKQPRFHHTCQHHCQPPSTASGSHQGASGNGWLCTDNADFLCGWCIWGLDWGYEGAENTGGDYTAWIMYSLLQCFIISLLSHFISQIFQFARGSTRDISNGQELAAFAVSPQTRSEPCNWRQ